MSFEKWNTRMNRKINRMAKKNGIAAPYSSSNINIQPCVRRASNAKLNAENLRLVKHYDTVIGIDVGSHTGLAIWDTKRQCLTELKTVKIHQAMKSVFDISERCKEEKTQLLVRFEDARQRKWFDNAGKEKLQGAGAVKRESTIWEEFLADIGVDFDMVAPKHNMTKMSAEYFNRISKWQGRSSEHSRDAASLILGWM